MNKVWECIKVNHNDFVVFMKSGNFYKVFGDDIYVVWKITDYKIIDNHHVGFSLKSLKGILDKLSLIHISYIIYDKDDDYLKVNEFDNQYNSFMINSKNDYLKELRIKNTVSKFERLIKSDIEMLEYYEYKLQ